MKWWESKMLSANQMLSSCLCFFKIIPSPPWIFVLPASALISLAFANYLVPGFGFLSVFLYTSLLLVFSTVFCSCTASNHRKAICDVGEAKSSMEERSDQREEIAEAEKEEEVKEGDNNGGEEETSYFAEERSDQREDIAEVKEQEEEVKEDDNNGGEEKTSYCAEKSSKQREDITEAKEEEEGDNNNCSTRSPDSGSNSESHQEMSSTSEESDELDCYWPLDRSTDGSDGSISDEESLIEIALPTGHYSLKHQQQQQHSLMMMELLAEYNFDMNEEDNLIEIDISMGSIKSYSSRFEIQARN